MWYYLSGPFLGFLFYHRDLMARLTRGFHAIATGQLIFNQFVPRPLRDFFSGWCVYSPLQVGRSTVREAIWTSSYRSFAEDGGAVRAFTICPGYDDTQLASPQRSQSRYRLTSRRGTRTYEYMQQVALDLDPSPDLVVVTSFNEFHENTHIEPSVAFGDIFLRSTRVLQRGPKNPPSEDLICGGMAALVPFGDHLERAIAGDSNPLSKRLRGYHVASGTPARGDTGGRGRLYPT